MRLALLAALFAVACTHKILPDETQPDGGKMPTPNPGWTSGTRLRAHVTTGEDGSKQFAGWYDSQRKEDCSFMAAPDGMQRCMPASIQGSGILFGDGQCLYPLAHRAKGCGGPVRYATIYTPSGANCAQPTSRFYNVGATYTSDMLFANINGTCTQQPITNYAQNDEWFFTGPEISSNQFTAAVDKIE